MKSIAYIPEQAILAAAPSTPAAGYVKTYRKPDGGWYELPSTGIEKLLLHTYRAMVPADFTIDSTVLVTPVGFSFDVGEGQTWIFECCLIGDVRAVPDIVARVNAPATAGRFVVSSVGGSGARHSAINTTSAMLPLSNGNDEIRIAGGFTTDAVGNVSVQISNNSSTTIQTFYAGSWIHAERVS